MANRTDALLLMVVDDDLTMLTIAKQVVSEQGWGFFASSNGETALEDIEDVKPDLVLLDVNLPDINGFEVCRRIRQISGFENLPVVMGTGQGDAASIEMAFEVGATDFEVKPFNWQLLLHRTRYRIRNARMTERCARAARALQRSQVELRRAYSVAQLGQWSWDSSTATMKWSEEAFALVGVSSSQVQPGVEALARQAPVWDRRQCAMRFRKLLDDPNGGEFVQCIRTAAGQERFVLVRGEPLGEGRMSGLFQDVSQREAASESLRRLAYLDPLTELPNYTLFEEQLEQALEGAPTHVALLLLTLDSFGRVKDSVGAQTADGIVKEVAARIVNELSVGEATSPVSLHGQYESTAARVDEFTFAIILRQFDSPADVVAARVARQLITSIAEPIRVQASVVSVTASVGVAVAPSSEGFEALRLFGQSKTAMSAAKKFGAGTYSFFEAELESENRRRLNLIRGMHAALDRDEFFLVYQPKVDIVTGKPCGAEALLRWQSPEFGLVPPDEFIALAEESGLILKIGAWVLKEATKAAARWLEQRSELRSVAVNVSALQFCQAGFVDDLRALLAEVRIPPEALELEITETLLAANADHAKLVLHQLRELGVVLSIDDFGTGYSSLSYLKQFPVNNLKIDRCFITDMESDNDDAVIAATIIRMAESLGLTVIAEGVETSGQLSLLRRERCDIVQGHYFARAMREEELSGWAAQFAGRRNDDEHADGLKVLLVDDDARLLDVSRQVLARSGYEVRTASNVDAAFNVLANETVAVVISDYSMGGMDGVEFLNRVSRIHPDITRIMMSGEAEREAVIAAVNSGAIQKYFDKPVSLVALRSAVRDAMAQYAMRTRAA